MRVPPSFRLLALFTAVGAGGLGVLAMHAPDASAGRGGWLDVSRATAAADTDSVAVTKPDARRDSAGIASDSFAILKDSLGASDSLVLADTTVRDTLRVQRYLGLGEVDRPLARFFERRPDPLGARLGEYWQREIVLDSASLTYRARETVGGQDVRVPAEAPLPEYRAARLETDLALGFRDLAARRERIQRAGRGGFGITIDIPGGNQSAFSSIFGRNEVDLRVNGQANIDVGLDYQQSELQAAVSGNGGQINPDFGQELSLGITGTIGDKLRVNVNYDTQNAFDFENQVSLVYTGYDDDIVQRVEAGNVFLQTPAELIRGGQRLFGLRTDLRFGGLGITAVASQQDAESSALTLEGGSQTSEFSLAPYQYEDNTHFFVAYHFRNWWDAGHADPRLPTGSPGLGQIVALEVWKHDREAVFPTGTEAQTAFATALADLGEPGPGNTFPDAPPRGVLAGGDAYLDALGAGAPLPNPDADQYDEDELAQLRDSLSTLDPQEAFDLGEADFENNRFRRLRRDVDYTYDELLGTLSLNASLTENEMLAVSYQYVAADGVTVVEVGDFGEGSTGGSSSGDRIVLKLLRGNNPTPTAAPWALTMRNIYRVGGRSLNPSDFAVQVFYEPNGQTTALKTLPGVTVGQQQTLLQTLGLDRLNRDGLSQPDDVFDFRAGYTIDAAEGRIIFPFLEPFGARVRSVLRGEVEGLDVTFQGATTAETAVRAFAFDTLYQLKPEVAARSFPNLNNYAIAGQYRGTVESTFNLGFSVVENSVRVTSGSIELVEGRDYTVDYASGTVQIISPQYLAAGQNLRVEFENNQFAAIGSKTLLGLRADYTVGEDFGLGATLMRLSEKPLNDKYRIGEEPLSNGVFGFDGRYDAEPRWITRALDWLPLIQTRAPSSIEFRGEFAQLLPGHPETFAFQQERDALQNVGRDFQPDELGGISFVDDFEGIENALSLTGPGAWRNAAPPSGAGPDDAIEWSAGTPVTDPRLPSNWRGRFAWYALSRNIYQDAIIEEVGGVTEATAPISVEALFPERERSQGQPDFVSPLDLYFDPTQRGPYNYNGALETQFAADPRTAWGGMVQRLLEGYTDFDADNNIEFVEFLFSPTAGRDGTEDIAPGAVLHVDLGSVSEDVLPNRRLNSEDGLEEQPVENGGVDAWGRFPTGPPLQTVDFDEDTRRTEDLGLDGLRSAAGTDGGTPYVTDERDVFSEFVEALTPGSAVRAAAEEDPSADDYHHFEEAPFFLSDRYPDGRASLQERFARFFAAPELNAFESQQEIANSGEPGNSRYPDSEDLNDNFDVDLAESVYRYTLPLDEAALRASPYFQNDIVLPDGRVFYLVRIPVRATDRQAIGGIQDFSRIETIRLWTTGHDRPATLRFATLELVGSQWLKSDNVGIADAGPILQPAPGTGPQLFIETVNNEETPDELYTTPVGAIVSRTRDLSGALQRNREQSLVFRVEDLGESQARAVYRPYTTNRLDLTKYSNVRMFVHGEGFERRDSVRVFVRLGSNETDDYYELSQPVYPYTPPGDAPVNADSLWQTNVPTPGGGSVDLNSINVPLAALNQLKAERDAARVSFDEPYVGRVVPEGAPPGTRLTIRGNPSIRTVASVVMGVQNGMGGTTSPLENVEVWFNELRVSGYDEQSGWSAFARANVQLADVAAVNARVSRQTDGFGELGGGLGDRTFSDQEAYSLIATVNAHRLLPERFGWSVPVSLSITQNEAAPRYSPQRGDIRVEELVAQAEADPTLSAEQRAESIRQIREGSQTAAFSRTIRVPFSKTGSRSDWLRYTLDGIQVVYTNSVQRQRTPSLLFNDDDRWSGSFTYRLAVPRPRTVRPFWFLPDVPVIGLLGGLRLNYLPQQFRFTADADRGVGRDQQRAPLVSAADSLTEGVPDRFLYPVRRDHRFVHGRGFDVQYNPFTFLALGFRSDVTQSLTSAGADETFALFVRDDSTGLTRTYETSRDSAFAPGGPAALDFEGSNPQNLDIREIRELDVLPLGDVLSGVFGGERSVLTDRYGQNLTATLQPSLDRVRWLQFFRPQPISYSSQFNWAYTPLDSADVTVAGVTAQANIRTGVQLRPREFWRLFPFYRRIEQAEQGAADRRRAATADARRPSARPPTRPVAADTAGVGAPGVLPGETEGLAPPTSGLRGETPGADTTRTSRRPPFNPAALGRTVFLALTGVEDFTVTYNGTQSSAASGVEGGAYSFLQALAGRGPSLGYRLGLDRRIAPDDRFGAGELQIQDRLDDQHDFDARTGFRFGTALNVNLTWGVNWTQNDLFTLSPNADGVLTEQVGTRTGRSEATILAFGGSYDALLQRHLERYQRDVAGGADGDGRVPSDVLAPAGVAEDFHAAFVQGAGRFGAGNLFELPLPNWEVNYSGLSNWPLFRRFTQSVTLRHGYSSTYATGTRSNAAAGQPGRAQVLGGQTLISTTPALETSSAVVNERFQPLVGLNVAWRGGFQTDFTVNRSATFALSPASASLAQGKTQELSVRLNYARTGLRLPLPFLRRRRLNNNLRFSLVLSRTQSEDQTRFLRNDLALLLGGGAAEAPPIVGSTRFSVEPRLSYALSNQVSVDVFVRYENLESVGSQIPGTILLDGGFNFRVSFSN